MNQETLALIPARSGSKKVPNKNIRPFLGKPLLAHSIEQALSAESIDRVIVSTDCPNYAKIAVEFGAEVPFLRPENISDDLSTDLEVFGHALKWLTENEGYLPNLCVHLRPTFPLREVADIDAVVSILTHNSSIDSVRSVAPAQETPFKMWFQSDDGLLDSVCMSSDFPEAHSAPRQSLRKVFLQNAAIDAIRTSVLLQGSMTGRRVHGYVMSEDLDIDDLAQFAEAELIASMSAVGKARKSFCFDIDGVIATIVSGNEYGKSRPYAKMINHINALYDRGHHIIINTARGSKTGIDWKKTTHRQLVDWGVRYHELHFGKPAADYYVDDRMLPLDKVSSLATALEKAESNKMP